MWYVLHVKSRQEKALASDMERSSVFHYLPLIDKVSYYGNRRFRVQMPLFPGYVFLRGTQEEVFRADRTRRVVRIISVPDQEELESEITNIRQAITQGAELAPHRVLQKGWRVEVQSGPFQGLQGIVEDRIRANRLVLQVELLGQAVSMEVDGDLLAVLSPT